jgi:hypothetical protein
VVVVGVVGVVVAAVVVVYIYPLFSGPAAPYLFYHGSQFHLNCTYLPVSHHHYRFMHGGTLPWYQW